MAALGFQKRGIANDCRLDETRWRHFAATAGQRRRARGERAGAVYGLGDR